jgi:hypothetical protein
MDMKRIRHFLAVLLGVVMTGTALAQVGGGFGGGGGVAAGQQGGGSAQRRYEERVRQIEDAVDSYFDEPEIRNILTPGEFSEWKLTLKSGDVVIADAKSDAFDPALEVVEGDKVIATNDDRYPGDQRPLLLWRCTKDGDYALRARCFRDKSGGQFFLRLRTLRSLSLDGEGAGELDVSQDETFLVRIPMRAGQIKRYWFEVPDRQKYVVPALTRVIAPNGLPDIGLAEGLRDAVGQSIMAPVAGDYYVLAVAYENRKAKVRLAAAEVPQVELKKEGTGYSGIGTMNEPRVWRLALKKGEIWEGSAPTLAPYATIIVAEQPDVSKYKLDDSENNPFFPKVVKQGKEEPSAALTSLPARSRDGRYAIFVARRDVTVWIASVGSSPAKGDYTLTVEPATTAFVPDEQNKGTLRIGDWNYWAFDAKAGDVMTLNAVASGFASEIRVLDPDYAVVRDITGRPDDTSFDWSIVVQKPGRYLVSMSAVGGGGGGSYALSRKVFSAKTFGKGAPARGDFSSGRAEVWKMTVTPDDPALLRWWSESWGYSVTICDENGAPTNLPRTAVDDHNQYGVLRVTEPKTYVIVLISSGPKVAYSFELSDLPGLSKKG